MKQLNSVAEKGFFKNWSNKRKENNAMKKLSKEVFKLENEVEIYNLES